MANVKGTYGEFGLIFHAGGLLLVQRGPKADGSPDGRWNLPGGGIDESDVAASRTPQGVMVREVAEETCLVVEIADPRPIGTYATAGHTDRATTWLCRVVSGEFQPTKEAVQARYLTPTEIMELARIGDKEGGLLGGLKTSTGGVPRQIQMCLQAFTRQGEDSKFRNTQYWGEAFDYCEELGIPQ